MAMNERAINADTNTPKRGAFKAVQRRRVPISDGAAYESLSMRNS